MRHRSNIIVLTRPGLEPQSRAFVASVCSGDRGLAGAHFEYRPVRGFDPSACDQYDLVIVDGEEPSTAKYLSMLVDEFEHADVPVVRLSRDRAVSGLEGEEVDVMTFNVSTDPSMLAGQLRMILKRQEVVRKMRRELKIAQRFQGGLRGEITRIHEELQLAAMVQREFLPREIPQLHGVEFAALWRPANYVSGDIYDITRLDEDHVGVFIADAVGHGVPAALMTMVIARALPSKEVSSQSYRIVPPDEALRRLNGEMIRRQGETTRFATAVYAIIDCRSRVATIAGAGHPPPLLYRRDEMPLELETEGGLLGVFEDESFESIEVELEVDDRLLFYSDGFEVAFPEDASAERSKKMPTKQYLDEFLNLKRQSTAAEMIQEIGRRIDTQPGSLHQIDDLTLICLRAGALGEAVAAPVTRVATLATS